MTSNNKHVIMGLKDVMDEMDVMEKMGILDEMDVMDSRDLLDQWDPRVILDKLALLVLKVREDYKVLVELPM